MKIIISLMAVLLVFSPLAYAGNSVLKSVVNGLCLDEEGSSCISAFEGLSGPAPNSGDGDPDGSGFTGEPGSETSPGPAPNSGDGIHDGSGF